MTQPLHFTPKAIADLLAHPCPGAPLTAIGNRYIAAKLREAQVFVLSDGGQLLDRSKPRPEVPGVMFRPSFPVVALEYVAANDEWVGGPYDMVSCSKRIALAWEWQDDLPVGLAAWKPTGLGAGVVVASVCYHDESATWMVVPVAVHVPFEDPWTNENLNSPFRDAMIAQGRIPRAVLTHAALAGRPIAISPETITAAALKAGGVAAALDMATADTMDEVNAYFDLCVALACKNVSTREHPAPKHLNRQRIKKGKLPLKGFHVLELAGGDMPGAGAAAGGDRSTPRSHLRRGHIRRLAADRVTWVNSTIVRGRGFIDKVYAA